MNAINPKKLNESERNAKDKLKNDSQEKKLILNIWNCLFLVTVVAEYFSITICYVILKQHFERKIYYLILLFDCIYIADFFLAVADFIWTKQKYRNKNPRRNELILIINLILSIPYSHIYETSASSFNKTVILYLRLISILRLFHVVLFFKDKFNTVGINYRKCFTFQFLIYFVVGVHAAACLWHSAFQDFAEKSLSEQYVICVYFALMSITNRNFGDFTPGGLTQKIFSSI